MRRSIAVLALVALLLIGGTGARPALAAPTFADVPTGYWAFDQIEQFAARGITTGCGTDAAGQRLFCPERGVTRAEMAVFLDRTLGQGELADGRQTFADVPPTYWAYGFIERFFTLGITTGCGEDAQGRLLFCPERGVTRAEMAVFIDRAKGLGPLNSATPTFADVPTDYWAYGFIERFAAQGITTGCGTDSSGRRIYCPDRNVNRAEMAVFITRAFPAPSPAPTPPPTPAPTPTPSPAFNPQAYLGQGDKYNCTDFASQAQAQSVLRADPSDPNVLDGNRDGIACEGNPAPRDLTPVPR